VARSYLLSLARAATLAGAWLIQCPGAVYPADAEEAPMLTLVETDNGRTVDVHVGATVRIVLPENATTGYRWAIDRYDQDLIEALATEPNYGSRAVGTGGEVAFSFQAKKAGAGEIALKNWRSWEGDASVRTRFRARLNIGGP
jgi:inhibitor of cysteine peptidase